MTTGRSGTASGAGQSCYRYDEEPSLQELIDDPVMQAIMARDGVDRAGLVRLVVEVRTRLERRAEAVELLCD